MITHITRRPWLAVLSAALVLLSACGGGGGGIGSGGTGAAAMGTVDGFGSIFIGGERCDDVGARIEYDTVPGGPEPVLAEAKLGQRVEADLDGSSVACKILVARIAPEVVGVVSNTSPLTVAGAQIVINADPAVGPVTVFDGYDSAADIVLGDRIEVHGKAVAVTGGVAIRATRVERKPATDTWVRVAGVIQNLNSQTFTLGGLTVNYSAQTTVFPPNLALANGQTVAMWSLVPVSGNSATAKFIRVLRRNFPHQSALRVEGPVSGCNGASPCTTPVIDGVQVVINGTTTFTFGTPADVVDGRTMHVRGTFDAANGQLVATAVAVRRFDPNAGLVTLIGTVSEFSSAGSETNFRVRGVPVTTDGATVIPPACSVSDGQLVAVAGHIAGSSVLATRIECPALAVGTVVDAYAQVAQLDSNARTFKLGGVGPLLSLATLHWDENTLFANGVTAATLANGQYVAVRGVFLGAGQGFLLTRVILDQTPPSAPGGGLAFRTIGVAHDIVANSSLKVGRIALTINGGTVVDATVVNGTVVRAWFYRDVPNARWVALLVLPAPLF
jgi:hypothetical protein